MIFNSSGTAGLEAFSPAEEDPEVSKNRFNPTTSSGSIAVRTFKGKLIQAHAILMLIAWPMITLTGIFFAAWMKPALPNGEWFQVTGDRVLVEVGSM